MRLSRRKVWAASSLGICGCVLIAWLAIPPPIGNVWLIRDYDGWQPTYFVFRNGNVYILKTGHGAKLWQQGSYSRNGLNTWVLSNPAISDETSLLTVGWINSTIETGQEEISLRRSYLTADEEQAMRSEKLLKYRYGRPLSNTPSPQSSVKAESPAASKASPPENKSTGLFSPKKSAAMLVNRNLDGTMLIDVWPHVYMSGLGCTMVMTEHGATSEIYYVIGFSIEGRYYSTIWGSHYGSPAPFHLDSQKNYRFLIKPLRKPDDEKASIHFVILEVWHDGRLLLDKTASYKGE